MTSAQSSRDVGLSHHRPSRSAFMQVADGYWRTSIPNRLLASATTRLLTSSPGAAQSAASVALMSAALGRVRETVHTIEDRVRRLLTPDGPSIGELRILVVDDHPDSADSLVMLLDLVGRSARASYGGWSALQIAEAFQPDVCLLD